MLQQSLQIIEELHRIVPRPVQITPETRIARDLGLDSLAVMNFVMTLEERFDISIPMDRIIEIETVGDLDRTISALRADVPA